MIYTIRMIRKTSNFLPAIAGIALMTITACASASLGEFSKATQDAAIAAAVAEAEARAKSAQELAVDAARRAARCTDPVCDNVVKADDLPSYPTTVTINNSAFLTIEGTQISIAGLENNDGTDVATSDIDGLTRAGDDADGVQYFRGRLGNSGNERTFAGILPTTNLGAPLTAQPTTAVWPGTYSERGSTAASIDFNIDFINRRITATTEDTLSVAILRFNLGFSDSGVISGQVLEHISVGLDTGIGGSRVATGLIGTEGLVGVFIDNLNSQLGLRYVGGFVANNPDTNP